MDDYRPTPVPDPAIEDEPAPRDANRSRRSVRPEAMTLDRGISVRTIGFSVAGAAIAVALFWMARRATRRPRKSGRASRSPARAVVRELAREVTSRALVGAAGVIGARIANQILVPALTHKLATGEWRIESENERPKRRSHASE